jgi:hypothetical protein
MNVHISSRPYTIASLASALALFLTIVATPMASADTTGTVTITASVANELSLTLCDTEADFGDGLTFTGRTPSNTNDTIGFTGLSPNPDEGVFYSWTPLCQANATGNFAVVASSTPSILAPCATENTGNGASPTMTLTHSLRWDAQPAPSTTYADINNVSSFGPCPGGTGFGFFGSAGTYDLPVHFYLRVDPSDQAGTFSSIVVWTLAPL